MSKRNKKNSKGSANNTNSIYRYSSHRELSPTCLETPSSYPATVDKRMKNQLDVYTLKMIFDTPATTNSSGNLNDVFGNLPSVASNWSNIAAVFDEYRVLAMKLSFKSNFFTGGTLVSLAPIVSVVDLDTSPALTSYVFASNYSSAKEFKAMTNWSRTYLMSGTENTGFISTASPTTTAYIKVWSASNPASTLIGRYVVNYYVQFRGKGI